jgi:DnaJ-class molecular chaperone
MRCAYQILGISRSADEAEVRKAYRNLAKTRHPDQAGNSLEAEEAFIELKAAYDLLSDPLERSRYDQDPSGLLEEQVMMAKRRARNRRRRKRLIRLYD